MPKSGSADKVTNYCPVSITCTCSKLLEHIISKHLLSYINEYNLLSHHQHGFRQGLSTMSQLIELVHDLLEVVNFWGQGSVLGPLLFLLFINDLPNEIDVSIRLCADGCNMYSKIESVGHQDNLQHNLQKI